MVGSDHRAHYLFIGSSRLGDLTVVTTRRGGECAAPPHTEQAISQRCSEAVHLYSKQAVTGRESRRAGEQENTAAAVWVFTRRVGTAGRKFAEIGPGRNKGKKEGDRRSRLTLRQLTTKGHVSRPEFLTSLQVVNFLFEPLPVIQNLHQRKVQTSSFPYGRLNQNFYNRRK